MKRPWGVLLVAVLVLFMGGGVLFLEAVDGTMRGLLGEAISLGKWYAVVGVPLFLSLHAAYAVSAVGMLLRQNWARWLLLLSTPAF
ncbi:MAG: hypothetical protein NT049_17865, partial [Planctomycetota bacterium]|nr:hypothetical protein [Planctomycetota bacterium]